MTTMSASGEVLGLARARLAEILVKSSKLEVPTQELLATRPARKLLARTSGALGRCTLRLGLLILVLAGLYVYARWPTQEVETVRTVLRRTELTRKSCADLFHQQKETARRNFVKWTEQVELKYIEMLDRIDFRKN